MSKRHERLEIEGMHCGGCVKRVAKELGKLLGVDVDKVDIGVAELTVDESVPRALLVGAVVSAGYRVRGGELG